MYNKTFGIFHFFLQKYDLFFIYARETSVKCKIIISF